MCASVSRREDEERGGLTKLLIIHHLALGLIYGAGDNRSVRAMTINASG
jgi:hypothetical protein